GMTQAAFDKYTLQYLWPDHPVWARRSEQVLACLAVAAATGFARAFLDPRRRLPRLDRAMRVLPIAVAAGRGGGGPAARGGARGALILGAIAVITAAAVHAAWIASRNARVFLVAWTVLLVGAVMTTLTALGVVAWQGGFQLMKLGSAVEAVLLSLALAGRINA